MAEAKLARYQEMQDLFKTAGRLAASRSFNRTHLVSRCHA